MQVSITGRHMQVSGETKEFIEDRIDRFLHYFDRVTSVQMTAIHDHDDVVVEFVIHAARGDTFVVKEGDTDIHAAVDRAAGKVERKLVKLKEKINDYRASKSLPPLEEVQPEDDELSYEGILSDLNEE